MRIIQKSSSLQLVSHVLFCHQPQYYTNVKGYELTDVGYLRYITVETGAGKAVEKKTTSSSPLALVTGRKTVVDNDGSAVEVVTAYTNDNGSTAIPTISNLTPRNAELSNIARDHHTKYPTDTVKFSDLKAGDIIQFVKDTFTGRIIAFTLLARAEDIKDDYSNNRFSENRWDSVITGNITIKDDYAIRISGNAIEHSIYGNSIPIMMNTTVNKTQNFDKVYRYNSNAETFELITANDIYEGARVWCYVEDKFFQYGVILVIIE